MQGSTEKRIGSLSSRSGYRTQALKPKAALTKEKLKDPTIADAFGLDLQNRFSLLEEVEDIEVLWDCIK